jgi:membrane fusion protein, multidrug efflux system
VVKGLEQLKGGLSPRQWRLSLLALGPAALLVFGGIAYLTGGHSVSTNNAYLKAGKVQVSADVAGRVIELRVAENAFVHKGDVLFRIDPAPFEIAAARAEAGLSEAHAAIIALQARHAEMGAELESAKADGVLAERAYDRQARLAQSHVASQSSLDVANQARAKAAQNIAAIEQQRAAILAELDGDPNKPVEDISSYRAAKAMLDQARLDLSHTTVLAGSDGLVSQTDNFRPGLYVRPGEALFSLVQTDVIWVEANMKETDVTNIRKGQPARVRIDAYPGREWIAEVDSLSAGTGSEFALLPPQNATGNWVKVTQRVPVRLKLRRSASDPPLRIGMSASVEIDTRDRSPVAADGSATRAKAAANYQ